MQKIKIVWLCHFSNSIVREQMPLSNNFFENIIRKIFKKNKKSYRDFAPWVNNLILEFEKMKNIELHIIAPHKGLKKMKYAFTLNRIHYHFYAPELFFPFRNLKYRITKIQNRTFKRNRRLIKDFIQNIQPDIVNLIGAENPYYAIAALDIQHIPVYLSAQTVYSNPDRMKLSGHVDTMVWDIEIQLHKHIQYMGCGGRMHYDLLKKNNPQAIIFKNFFPIQQPNKVKPLPKIYDFVFFAAGVAPKKGIEDALEALAIVNRQREATLDVVGSCNPEYKSYLVQKIKKLGLEDRVYFHDYFPVHADMHQHIVQARYALLPVKLDVIPGTIIEAILLDLPVVCYKTTGTPYLNSEKPGVLIAELNNVRELANHMLTLMESEILAQSLAKNAKEFVLKTFDNTTSAKRLLADYYAVLAHYHHGTPIPKELLFDTHEFPIY